MTKHRNCPVCFCTGSATFIVLPSNGARAYNRSYVCPHARCAVLCFLLRAGSAGGGGPLRRTLVMGMHGMVAAEHPLEARVGVHVLESGGNAFDAAIAVFYMTSVVEQHQAGLGGDAVILAYVAKDKRVIFINGTGELRNSPRSNVTAKRVAFRPAASRKHRAGLCRSFRSCPSEVRHAQVP